MTDLEEKAQDDIQKVLFLASGYPKKTVTELAAMFQDSPLNTNTAIWRTQDLGYLTVEKDGKFTLAKDKLPEEWKLGPEVDYLLKVIPYVFKRLAKEESDMEENFFGTWSQGYASQDVIIALKILINDQVLAMYELVDGLNDSKNKKTIETYTFYCLAENRQKEWGRKQFKDPSRVKSKK